MQFIWGHIGKGQTRRVKALQHPRSTGLPGQVHGTLHGVLHPVLHPALHPAVPESAPLQPSRLRHCFEGTAAEAGVPLQIKGKARPSVRSNPGKVINSSWDGFWLEGQEKGSVPPSSTPQLGGTPRVRGTTHRGTVPPSSLLILLQLPVIKA